jgi:hypothetical protein
MPDLLSHTLFGYAGIVLASRWFSISRAKITAFLFGAVLPDVSKVGLFFNDDFLEAAVGGPIDFLGWHTLLGVTLSICIALLLVDDDFRLVTATIVAAGAVGHILLDMLLRTASGLAPYALLWPISGYRPPTPGLYLSGDLEVLIAAIVVATVAHLFSYGVVSR